MTNDCDLYSDNELISKQSTSNGSENKLPWIEKYRPQNLDQIISHTEIIKSLQNFIDRKTLPHLLFFGPSGSGKTSTIICCARKIYKEYMNYMVLQLNASNERGIDTVRNTIKHFVSNRSNIFLPEERRNVFKLVILDEIDSMTIEAQGMLRQTIEKNSDSTRFCLICNEIDKVNVALQSRCTLFRFAPLNMINIKQRLSQICDFEKIKHAKNVISIIAKHSKGDMRAAINILQSIKLSIKHSKISIDDVYKISGYCTPETIAKIFEIFVKLSKSKIKINVAIKEIHNIITNSNITIFNLLDELKNIIIESNFTQNQKIFLIDRFAINEIFDSINIDCKNIIMNLTSSFILVETIN